MIIEKPKWLKEWLASGWMNPRIFAWELSIGDWIEKALDWVRDWLNWLNYQAELAYNWAIEVWEKAKELADVIWTEIGSIWNRISDIIEVWWSNLGEWWETTKTTILEWINIGWSLFNDWWKSWVTELWEWIDITLMPLLSKVAELFDITKEIGDFADVIWSELTELGKEHYILWDATIDFITNPVKYFMTQILPIIIEDFVRGFDRGLKGDKK